MIHPIRLIKGKWFWIITGLNWTSFWVCLRVGNIRYRCVAKHGVGMKVLDHLWTWLEDTVCHGLPVMVSERPHWQRLAKSNPSLLRLLAYQDFWTAAIAARRWKPICCWCLDSLPLATFHILTQVHEVIINFAWRRKLHDEACSSYPYSTEEWQKNWEELQQKKFPSVVCMQITLFSWEAYTFFYPYWGKNAFLFSPLYIRIR